MLDAPVHTPTPATPQPQPITSGFTPVNIGGFTPVNAAPATFTPVPSIIRRDREESGFTPPRRPYDSPLSSAKNTPEYRPSGLGAAPIVNGFTSHPLLKRQMSHDSIDSRNVSQPPEDAEGEGRRSKRLKKGMYILHYKFLVVPKFILSPKFLLRGFWWLLKFHICDWPFMIRDTDWIIYRSGADCGWVAYDFVPTNTTSDTWRSGFIHTWRGK